MAKFQRPLGPGSGIVTPPPSKPTQVFQSPQGLLDFLGTKTVGHNPDLCSQTLQPTLNLMPFYLAGQEIKRAVLSTLNAALFIRTDFVVPNGRAWIPLFQGLTYQPQDVGGQCRARVILQDPAGFTLLGATMSPNTATQPAGTAGVCSIDWYVNPVLVPAGFTFGVFFELLIPNPAVACAQTHTLSYIELIV